MARQAVSLKSQNAWRVRGWSLAGALLVLSVLWLGVIWPSLFTVVALLTAPAVILLLIGVFWPPFYAGKNGMRLYLRVCLILAAASWVFEILWLTFHRG